MLNQKEDTPLPECPTFLSSVHVHVVKTIVREPLIFPNADTATPDIAFGTYFNPIWQILIFC